MAARVGIVLVSHSAALAEGTAPYAPLDEPIDPPDVPAEQAASPMAAAVAAAAAHIASALGRRELVIGSPRNHSRARGLP